MQPALAKSWTISDDGLTYTFQLKQGVMFIDDACFAGGKGREVVARDLFYSWKRMADNDNKPKSWWLLEDTIVGFDAYRKAQNAADTFDYDVPVEGMKLFPDDPHRFQVVLTHPKPVFLNICAMFQLSAVPREAAEEYGTRFSRHPVGSGTYMLEKESDWIAGKSLTLTRNPGYRDERYPTEWEPGDEALGLHEAAGKRIPFLDRIEVTFFVETQPQWLEFRAFHLDFTTTPAENFEEAFVKRTRKLRSRWKKKGVVAHAVPLLDFIFRGFNMDDELVGGYTDKKRALRRALHLAVDLHEFNDIFYNGINTVYDGPIPPGMAGYPENGRAPGSNQGPNLDEARALLKKAGYPGGKGLPKLDYWVSAGGVSKEQSELMQRQLGKIGVELNVRLVDFSQLIAAVHTKKAQVFSFAWGSDYPDAENNLALFFGPNEAPGANSFNYKNPKFDALYKKIRSMQDSPERTAIYERMRDMVIRDVPYIGSMGRIRYYLLRPWLRNCKPTEVFNNWWKYLDIDESRR